jgi:hypothetical protein
MRAMRVSTLAAAPLSRTCVSRTALSPASPEGLGDHGGDAFLAEVRSPPAHPLHQSVELVIRQIRQRPVDLGESRGRGEQGREHLAGQLLPLRLGQGQGLVFQRGALRTVLSASMARNDSITPSVTVRKPKAGARYV